MKHLIAAFILLAAFAAPCTAQESKRVEINVESSLEPVRAVGLLIGPSGTKQKATTRISSTDLGIHIVSFDVRESEIEPGMMATALVEGDSGSYAYGNVRPLFPGITGKSALSLPQCAPKSAANPVLMGDLSSLLTLVDVRETRREVLQKKVKMLLKGDLLSTLQRLEEGFGINVDTPLSVDLPPAILLDRLTRVQAALAAYDAGRGL